MYFIHFGLSSMSGLSSCTGIRNLTDKSFNLHFRKGNSSLNRFSIDDFRFLTAWKVGGGGGRFANNFCGGFIYIR